MSILIKGGVMPLTCEECPCYDNNDYSCNVTGRGVIEYRFDGRPDDCPLVEVPTPHGRLIDADKLFCKIDGIKGWDYGDESDMAISAAEALSAIDDSPTVIEAEE